MSAAKAGPWKWDVSIYDRPGWIARFRGRGRLASPDGQQLYVRFEELERASYYGDYFMGRHRDTWLHSPDAGNTWRMSSAAEAPNVDGVALPDGSRLTVTHTVSLLRGEALRDYLDKAGLAHMHQEESFAWWELCAPDRKEELERAGRSYHTVRHPTEFLATLRDLSVGRCAPGSKEWTWTPAEGLPQMASLAGWWRQTGLVLPDGTLLGCVQGREDRSETKDSSYAMRSTDGGRTWSLSPIARATSEIHFSESFLFLKQDGRILAMIRANEGDSHLYRSVSADGGATWSPIEQTPIWGFPAHVIRLRSGALLCAYAHRRHPQGYRAVLSHDDGETWDYENEKILRDEAVGSVGYPMTVQLADGTLFTANELGKPVRAGQEEDGSRMRTEAGPEDIRGDIRPTATGVMPGVSRDVRAIDMAARPQSYITGTHYTEDYVRPLGS
jgi:hypothetical protein